MAKTRTAKILTTVSSAPAEEVSAVIPIWPATILTNVTQTYAETALYALTQWAATTADVKKAMLAIPSLCVHKYKVACAGTPRTVNARKTYSVLRATLVKGANVRISVTKRSVDQKQLVITASAYARLAMWAIRLIFAPAVRFKVNVIAI